MAQSKLTFGLVGAGGISQSYVQAFGQTDMARICGVADIRPEAAGALAEGLSCTAFTSHKTLQEKAKPEAVIICTPPNTHPEIADYFVSQGVHVLCEKPLCTDSGSARKMVAAADRAGVLLTMASKFRYVEDVIRAKSILTSGILGEIILFENAFTSRVDMTHRWNSNPAMSGGGVLIDNGTHSVDLMRYFLGPIDQVQAVEGKRVQSLEVEDTARIFIRSHEGVMGSIDLSWSINKELASYIEIYGSQGMIRVGWRESKYRQSSSSDWVVFGKGYDKVQAFRRQIENFCRAINKQEPLLIAAEDAIASVETIEAAYRSLAGSNWVSVKQGVAPTNGRSAGNTKAPKRPAAAHKKR